MAASGQSAAELFFRSFQDRLTSLQEQMDRLGDTALAGGERQDATDLCRGGISRLSSDVKDASGTIPSHDLKIYTEATKALEDKLAEIQALYAPKQKFSFKTRKNESAVSLHEAAELASQHQRNMLNFGTASGSSSFAPSPNRIATPPPDSASSTTQPGTGHTVNSSNHISNDTSAENSTAQLLTTTTTTTTISSQSNSHIIIPTSASRANTPCTLTNLRSCCIELSIPTRETAPFASVTVTNVESSLLLCASVAGPAHITGVKNSTIVISCRQLRMHDCYNVDVYLYCTSRPIIEDCENLLFAEMPAFYTDLLHSSGPTPNEAIGTNMWDHVDDFKWPRAEQSPNWMILPAEHRVADDAWKRVISAQPGMSVDDILSIAAVKK